MDNLIALARRTRLGIQGRTHLLAYIAADDRLWDAILQSRAADENIPRLQFFLAHALTVWANTTTERNEVEEVVKSQRAIMEEAIKRIVAQGFVYMRSGLRISAAKYLLEQGHPIKFVANYDNAQIADSMKDKGIPNNKFTSEDESIAGGHGFKHLVDFDDAHKRVILEMGRMRDMDIIISDSNDRMEELDKFLGQLVADRDAALAAQTQERATMRAEVDEIKKLGYVIISEKDQLPAAKSIFDEGHGIKFVPMTGNESVRRSMLSIGLPISQLE